MLTVKFFIMLCLRPFFFVVENHPGFGLGDEVKYHLINPFIISFILMLAAWLLYKSAIRAKLIQRRWFIAYMRFFTGIRKRRLFFESANILVFLVVITFLAVPENRIFRSTCYTDLEDLSERYMFNRARSLLGSQENTEILFDYLKEFQCDSYLNTRLGTQSNIDDSVDYDEDYEFLIDTFRSTSHFYNLAFAQAYLFSDLFMKDELRGAIFSLFPEQAEVSSSSDLDSLVDLFFKSHFESYVSRGMWWVPSAANAARFLNGPQIAQETMFLQSQTPFIDQVLASHRAKEPFIDYSFITRDEEGELNDDVFDQIQLWLAASYTEEYYQKVRRVMDFEEKMKPYVFDEKCWSIKEPLALQSYLSAAYLRLEKMYQKRSRKAKFRNLAVTNASRSAYGPAMCHQWKNEDRAFYYTQIEPFSRSQVYTYIQPITSSDFDVVSIVLPGWLQEVPEYDYVDLSYRNIRDPWKFEKRIFIDTTKNKIEYGQWKDFLRFRFRRKARERLMDFRTRYRRFYYTTFWLSTLRAGFTDPYEFMSDGDTPQNSIMQKSLTSYFRHNQVFRLHPADVFTEWPTMTDSVYSYNLTLFGEERNFDRGYDHPEPAWGSLSHFSSNFFDFATARQLGFQDPASPAMEGIIDLHHDLMFFLVVIVVFVMWFLVVVVRDFFLMDASGVEIGAASLIPSLKSHNVKLETVWSIVPACVLVSVSMPSFALVYELDDLLAPGLTLRVIGHQWYWSYDYAQTVPVAKYEDYSRLTSAARDVNVLFDDHYYTSAEFQTYYYGEVVSRHLFNKADFLLKFNAKSSRVSVVELNERVAGILRRIALIDSLTKSSYYDFCKKNTPLEELCFYVDRYTQKSIIAEANKHPRYAAALKTLFVHNMFKQIVTRPNFQSSEMNELFYQYHEDKDLSLILKLTLQHPKYAMALLELYCDPFARRTRVFKYLLTLSNFYDVNPVLVRHTLLNHPGVNLIKCFKKDFFFTSLVYEKSLESRMILDPELVLGSLRLLNVDKRVVLPIDTDIRVLVTSADVLHSWAVPALGFKLDACPGRLNQAPLHIKRTGLFYGQCSELCGVGHAFMPIVVEAVTPENFKKWFYEHYTVRTTK